MGQVGLETVFSVLLPVPQAKARELPMWDFGRIRWDFAKERWDFGKNRWD